MGNGVKKGRKQYHTPSAQTELFMVIAEQNHEKIMEYEVASDTIIVYNVINGQYVEEKIIAGYVKDDHLGRSFIYADNRDSYVKRFMKCLKRPTHAIADYRCTLGNKEPEWNRLYLVSVADEEGKVTRVAGRFVSIHKDKMIEEEMRHRAEIDSLTGVYNHKTFEEICGGVIPECDTNAIFLMLDVDDFKMINDTQGHTVGDMVLTQTAAILKRMTKNRGYASRLGGDEFAAFAWGFADMEDIHAFCDRLRSELKTIVFDMEYSASIGISVKGNRKLSFEDMYYEADQAVYASKKRGKNQFVFFDDIADTPDENTQETKSREAVLLEQTDEKALLNMYNECVAHMVKYDYLSGLEKVQMALNTFFDADVTALITWNGGMHHSIEECHRNSAGVTAKLLISCVENDDGLNYVQLFNDEGEICVHNVKELKQDSPELYERLAQCRIWSMIGSELKLDMAREGVWFVVNPRKHIGEKYLLCMLSEFLVSRMKLYKVLELREFETTHDQLTRLWNRNSFILWKDRWKEDEYSSVGIVTTDIVGLAEINQDFGYLSGSKKLVAAAKLLQSVFEGYRVFRYDEDEMLVFCPNMSKIDFEFLISCLREKIEELEFGLALGFSWRAYVNVKEQIVEAEVVMDNDKLCIIHGAKLKQRAEQYLIEEVEQLIAGGNYPVYFQPKVNVHTNETVGAEALVRQKDPDLGIVSPAVFIPVLEKYNVIHMVDLYVLEQAFKYQKEAIEAGRRVVPISTNFSKLTMIYSEITEKVRALVKKYDIPNELIHIEVTETVGDMDHVVIEKVTKDLTNMGLKLSLDDFGTHYSNLAMLIRYNFESAKIDRSMIREIVTNEKSRTVLNYMTALISDLGIQCIIEGIETEEQVDIIRKTKCEVIQGYYYGRPVPMDEFYELFMEKQCESE